MGSFTEDIRSNEHVGENTFEHLPYALILSFKKGNIQMSSTCNTISA